MTYAIEFKKSARKELHKIPPQQVRAILQAIEKLAHSPRSGDTRKLVGSNFWRLRVGLYRIIYYIEDGHLVITIVRIGHRKEIYRK